MTLTNWRKSTYSRAHQNCVEAAADHALVAARDSQDPDGPVIEVSPRAWTEFTTHVKHATSEHRGHHPSQGQPPA
jgi:beta-lactam-binding protein with PASTA domain